MKKFSLILCLFLGAQIGLGQVYLKSDRNSIKLAYEFDEEVKVYPVPTFLDSLNILKVISNDSTDKFIATYFFKRDTISLFDSIFDEDSLCYKINFEFYCGECANFHLEKILNDKMLKWVKINENKYVSKHKYGMAWDSSKKPTVYNSGFMEVIRTPNEDVCMRLDIYLKEIERKEWKFLVKGK